MAEGEALGHAVRAVPDSSCVCASEELSAGAGRGVMDWRGQVLNYAVRALPGSTFVCASEEVSA
jgi:hypothetical protein